METACGRLAAEGEAASGEAGESQGVVRAPWQTHLPAVRAVWDFRTGVVERAKTALLGSEAQIVPLFQGKQRGCAQNWRKIGMANKKIKFPLWLMPDTKATVECLYRQDGCNSQSEFIEKAILFYCGYLQSEYAGDFLPKILGETLEAILSMFGGSHRQAASEAGGRAKRLQSYSRFGHGYRRADVPADARKKLSGGAADERPDLVLRGASAAKSMVTDGAADTKNRLHQP